MHKAKLMGYLPLDIKQEGGNGVPPTPKMCGYPA